MRNLKPGLYVQPHDDGSINQWRLDDHGTWWLRDDREAEEIALPFPSDASLLSLPLHVALPLRFDLECYRNSIESCPSEDGDWMRAADVIEMLRKAGIGAEEKP